MHRPAEHTLKAFEFKLPLVEFFDKGRVLFRRTPALHGEHGLHAHDGFHHPRSEGIDLLGPDVRGQVCGVCPRLVMRIARAALLVKGVPVRDFLVRGGACGHRVQQIVGEFNPEVIEFVVRELDLERFAGLFIRIFHRVSDPAV